MKITEFKKGELITRSQPATINNGNKDNSYCGDKFVFVGVDEVSKIIFFVRHGRVPTDRLTISYAGSNWDEGWEYYPGELERESIVMAENYKEEVTP